MMELSGQIAFNATDAEPRVYAEHGEGRISVMLSGADGFMPLFVRGTPDEIAGLALRLASAVADRLRADAEVPA